MCGSSGIVAGLVKFAINADGAMFEFILIQQFRKALYTAMEFGSTAISNMAKMLMPKKLELNAHQRVDLGI